MSKTNEKGQYGVQVFVEEYTRHGAGAISRITYWSKDELKLWRALCDRHSYSYGWETDEGENDLTVPQLIEHLSNFNGDGCDAIFEIKQWVDGAFVPVENFNTLKVEEEEEVVDLDKD